MYNSLTQVKVENLYFFMLKKLTQFSKNNKIIFYPKILAVLFLL